jgi:hypothetical protein
MNARLSSVTACTVVQLRDPGQMHTSTDDWRYTRAHLSGDRRAGGFFQPYAVAIKPTGALEMHQKNEAFKSIEELRVLGALFEHDACIRSPDVSIGRSKINEVASA